MEKIQQDNVYKVNIREDLTGKKFGKLTVIKRMPDKVTINKNGQYKYYPMWLCECDCEYHNKKIVTEGSLRSGYTKSCGCLRNKHNNTYLLDGEYGIGYTYLEDKFYFDLEDYSKIKNYSWSKNAYGYMVAYVRGTGRNTQKHITMHNLITDTVYIDHNNIAVDHINGNGADNRKCNLRIVDRTQNNMNRTKQNNNTTGNIGVYFDAKSNKWFSRIQLYKEIIHLGMFEKYEDAVTARKEAEEKYFGEYSYDNSRNDGDLVSGNLD